MKPNYYDYFYNDLKHYTEDCPIELIYSKTIMEGHRTPELFSAIDGENFPVVEYSFMYDYINDGSIEQYRVKKTSENISNNINIDIKNEYPINARLLLIIITKDVQQSIALEEYFLKKFSNERILYIAHPNDEQKNIEIKASLNKEYGIERNKGSHNRLLSLIKINCTGCVLYDEMYHPAEIAFDENVRYDALKKIISFYDKSTTFEDKKLENLSNQELKNELEEKQEYFYQCAEKVLKDAKIVDDDLSDPYYLKQIIKKLEKNNTFFDDAISQVKTDINKYSSEKEKAEKERKKHIQDIVEREEKRIREEERKKEREKSKKNVYLSSGDPMSNIYIDAITADIKKRFDDEYNLPIFGGSTYMTFFKCFNEKTLSYPSILIKKEDEFSFDFHSYLIRNKNGCLENKVLDNYLSLPYIYGFDLFVVYNNETYGEARQIKDFLKSVYSTPIVLYVPNPSEEGTELIITLCVNMGAQEKIRKLDSEISCMEIHFNKYGNVYLYYDYDKDTIKYNPQCQTMLLKQALFSKKASLEIRKVLNNDLPEGYKTLITGQSPTQGFQGNSAYWALRQAFYNKQIIDRKLFDEAMSSVVKIYPFLYDRMMAGYSYDQIEQELLSYQNALKEKYYHICDLLEINKEDLKTKNSLYDLRSESALKDYLQQISNKDIDIKEAIANYIEKKENEVKKIGETFVKFLSNSQTTSNNSVQRNQINEEPYYEDYDEYDYEYSRGSSEPRMGFLKTTAAVVAGNAITNHFEHKREKQQLEELERRREKEERDRRYEQRREEMRRRNEENERRKKERDEAMRRYNAEVEAYYKAESINRERERKGLTPLPLPPRPVFPSI